jgi:hypothetical protein
VFNWNAERELAKRQVAELEERVTSLREKLGPSADDPIAVASTFAELDLRLFLIRTASLDRARRHLSFIENKVAACAKAFDALPYVELAGVCFSAAKWMPPGAAADAVRAHGAAFYAKAAATKEKQPRAE